MLEVACRQGSCYDFADGITKRLFGGGLFLAALCWSATTAAAPDCTCRSAGKRYELGSVVCIGGPNGGRLAQCRMHLNNTSWQILAEGCPSAALSTDGRRLLPTDSGRPAPTLR